MGHSACFIAIPTSPTAAQNGAAEVTPLDASNNNLLYDIAVRGSRPKPRNWYLVKHPNHLDTSLFLEVWQTSVGLSGIRTRVYYKNTIRFPPYIDNSDQQRGRGRFLQLRCGPIAVAITPSHPPATCPWSKEQSLEWAASSPGLGQHTQDRGDGAWPRGSLCGSAWACSPCCTKCSRCASSAVVVVVALVVVVVAHLRLPPPNRSA